MALNLDISYDLVLWAQGATKRVFFVRMHFAIILLKGGL